MRFFAGIAILAVIGITVIGCNLSGNKNTSLHRTKINDGILWTVREVSQKSKTDVFQVLNDGTDPAAVSKAEKAIKEIFPDGEYDSSINFFILKSSSQISLFDTGLKDPTPLLQSAGFSPADVSNVFITHIHPDHIGGLLDGNGNAVFPAATVFINEMDRRWMVHPNEKTKQLKELFDKVCRAYEGRLFFFICNAESLTSGITPMSISGHTPGHTGYVIESGKNRILILGDIFHCIELQTKYPDIYAVYDNDAEAAVSARKDVLDLLVSDPDMKCAGMHLPMPAIGHITYSEAEGYIFVPDKI